MSLFDRTPAPVAVSLPPAPVAAILPPDAPPSDPVLAVAPDPDGPRFYKDPRGQLHVAEGGLWRLAGAKAKAEYEASQAPAPTPIVAPEPISAAVPLVKRGPGRPRKTAPEPVQAAEKPNAETQEAMLEARKAVTSDRGPEGGPLPSLRLYNRCIPQFPTRRFEAYVDSMCQEIMAALGEPESDIRVSNNKILEFGKYKGALSIAIRERPPVGGDWLLLSSGEVYQLAADVVGGMCSEYVRGVA